MSEKNNPEAVAVGLDGIPGKEIPWKLVALFGILAAGGLLLVAAAMNRVDTSLAKPWVEFDSLKENDKLASFAQQNQNNLAGAAAHLKMARQQLAMGLREYPAPAKDPFPPSPDSKEAKEKPADTMALLKQAREGFDLARKSFREMPALELDCMVSGARASEALEDVDDARKRYQEVIDSPRFKDSAVAREVRQRMKEMDEKGRWKTVTQIESTLRKAGP